MNLIGLDPGLRSAAWAAIDHNRAFIGCGDVPAKEDRIDVRRLHNIFMDAVPPGETAIIVIEDVWVMPKQGIVSSAGFMRAAGAIEATAMLTRWPVHFVRPQAWKKHFGLIGEKKAGDLAMARLIWPDAPLKLAKHHGMADSLLLALWGLETLT